MSTTVIRSLPAERRWRGSSLMSTLATFLLLSDEGRTWLPPWMWWLLCGLIALTYVSLNYRFLFNCLQQIPHTLQKLRDDLHRVSKCFAEPGVPISKCKDFLTTVASDLKPLTVVATTFGVFGLLIWMASYVHHGAPGTLVEEGGNVMSTRYPTTVFWIAAALVSLVSLVVSVRGVMQSIAASSTGEVKQPQHVSGSTSADSGSDGTAQDAGPARDTEEVPKPIELVPRHRIQYPVTVHLGSMRAIGDTLPLTILEQGDEKLLYVDEGRDRIELNATLFNEFGDVICKIEKNFVTVDAEKGYTAIVDGSELFVTNKAHLPILRVRFPNPQTLIITGEFYMRREIKVLITESETRIGNNIFSKGEARNPKAVFKF